MFAADSVLRWLLSHLSWVTKAGALALAASVVVLLSAWWLRVGRRLGARLMLLGFGLTLLGAWVPSQTAGSRASEPAVVSGDVTSSVSGTIGSVSPGEAPDTADGISVSVRASAQGGWDVEVPLSSAPPPTSCASTACSLRSSRRQAPFTLTRPLFSRTSTCQDPFTS